MTLKLAVSSLTGNVYAGKPNKAGTNFVGKKHDVTDDFIHALLSWANFHGEGLTVACEGRTWSISVKEVASLVKENEK